MNCPPSLFFSNNVTSCPRCLSVMAAVIPDKPPPITAMFFCFWVFSRTKSSFPTRGFTVHPKPLPLFTPPKHPSLHARHGRTFSITSPRYLPIKSGSATKGRPTAIKLPLACFFILLMSLNSFICPT